MFLEDTPKTRIPGEGWIEVICGSMFSGKTEELLRRLNRAKIANLKIEIFKPSVDNRYGENEVVSHNENAHHSTVINHSSEILEKVMNADVVGIDEAQFFDDNLPDVCNQMANEGIRVIIAGLDMDYQGNPFGPMPHLLAIAEYVTKVHAICVKTGKLANYSHRKLGGENKVEIGELDRYEPLSRKAFIDARKSSE